MSTTERLADQARDRLVTLHGHFVEPVRIETVEPITEEMLLVRVRTAAGSPAETVLTVDDLEVALKEAPPSAQCVDPLDLFRWVEGQRIRLAYAHDPYFAVSLCGVRGLPHQIEAVYRHLLPQPRLRFVLADDPGAGKTIMGGLLLKELKLRGVVDRTLVVAPAPLTVQWQDELLEKFDEHFVVVSSIQVKGQLGGNPWQRHSQVVTSLDFAKREEVLPDLLRAEWDFVVIDEAHKCAAVTESDGVRRTRRYVLAEELSRRAERLLLLTATPHSGDEDRFTHFLRLLDSDQFATSELVKRQIGLPDNPYFLRRQKEHLVDERGRKLFVPRTVRTQPFTLSDDERALYDEVTEYVNRFLGATGGGRGFAVALARTVLQRRLASSLGAIRSSLRRRAERLHERANELERLGSAERRKRLVELRVLAETDDETGTDDADEGTQDAAAVSVSAAAHLDQLREEVYELRRLTSLADTTMRSGEERKLGALRSCLQSAELTEVRDGRGKLLIFTEHRDTLMYLVDHLRGWGYSVCAIHGGHPATARKAIQHEFQKEDRERAAHQDAVLCSPGHPLFAALGEALDRALAAAGVPGGVAAFVDPSAREPYRIHFLTFEVVGESAAGEPSSAHAEVAAVLEDAGGQLAPAPPDVLHDLTPGGGTRALPPPGPDIVRPVTNWVRATGQSVATIRERERRRDQAELRARYLEEAFDAQRSTLESRWAEYEERVFKGEEDYRLLRDETARRVDELERRRAAKLDGFAKLGVVRAGPVTYLGCAVVAPPDAPEDPAVRALRQDPEVERAAMRHVMAHEVAHGRDPEDISQRRDGTGFDIRSIGRDPETGELEVRRIEVKGRSAPSGDVGLYRTEWFAARRFRAGYWLYVVYGAGAGTERLVTVQDPFGRLRHVHEVTQVTGYRVPSASIEAAAKTT